MKVPNSVFNVGCDFIFPTESLIQELEVVKNKKGLCFLVVPLSKKKKKSEIVQHRLLTDDYFYSSSNIPASEDRLHLFGWLTSLFLNETEFLI